METETPTPGAPEPDVPAEPDDEAKTSSRTWGWFHSILIVMGWVTPSGLLKFQPPVHPNSPDAVTLT